MSATAVEIEAEPLHRVHEWVFAHVKCFRKAQDRRGLQFLQLETSFSNVTGKTALTVLGTRGVLGVT